MTFNLFKKKITAEEMAASMYHATVSNTVKDNLKDQDENIILTKKEQLLVLTQYLYDLMDKHGLKKVKIFFLTAYVANNHKIKDNNDLVFQMSVSLDAIEKVRKFFKEILPERHKFFKQKFLFNKELSSIQKILVMQWYISHCKIIDSAFKSGMKRFKVADEE